MSRRNPRSGGRAILWTVLHSAALPTSRRSPPFKAFRDRLHSTARTVKAAPTAAARKLLVTLNAMIANGSDNRAQPATRLGLPANAARFSDARMHACRSCKVTIVT